MRKNLLMAAAFFVLSASPTLAIYNIDSNTTGDETVEARSTTTDDSTEKDDKKVMLMSATAETKKNAREEAKDAMKDKIDAAREEFKTKMKEIKDERKQKALTNLDGRIGEINKKRTDQMTEHLERFTLILAKISTKEASLKAEGKNTTTLIADIATASNAIDLAKTAVAEQAAKDYVVDVTTEEALRTSASTTVKQFIADIKAVMEKVRSAQKALKKAHLSAVKLEVGATITPTTTITPTITLAPIQ